MKWNCLTLALALAAAGGLCGCKALSHEAAIDRYVSGRLAMEREDFETALAELRKAVEIDPELALAHAAIGDVHRKQGDYDPAARAYQQACAINPYAFRPHYNLGVTYQCLAAAAGGVQAMESFMRRAVRIYLRAVSLRPGDFDTNLNLSACYFQQGKYDLADQYCQAAVKISPGNPYAHSNLGIIYDAQNRPYDAIRAYKDSLELDIHQAKLLLNLGSTYLRLGRVKDALHVFELAAKEEPDSPDPWVQMGSCHFQRRRWEEALAAYEKAIALDDRCAEGHRGLGVVQMTQFLLNRQETALRDKGLKAWNRSLELNSNQVDLLKLVRKYTPKYTGPEL